MYFIKGHTIGYMFGLCVYNITQLAISLHQPTFIHMFPDILYYIQNVLQPQNLPCDIKHTTHYNENIKINKYTQTVNTIRN